MENKIIEFPKFEKITNDYIPVTREDINEVILSNIDAMNEVSVIKYKLDEDQLMLVFDIIYNLLENTRKEDLYYEILINLKDACENEAALNSIGYVDTRVLTNNLHCLGKTGVSDEVIKQIRSLIITQLNAMADNVVEFEEEKPVVDNILNFEDNRRNK